MFIDVLRDLMDDKQLNQKQLAVAANILTSTINGWFNYNKLPNYNNIKSLAMYFNITSDYLLGLSSDDQKTTAEENLLRCYRQLSADSRELATSYIQNLLQLEQKQQSKGVQKNA